LFAVAVTALSASSASKQPLPYPDLFIIGAQKCGTTTLNLLLQRHPSFCDQGLKEKHFFSDDKAYVTNYDAHVAKFLGEFKKCNKSLLTIDATPSYVWLDYVPGFVKESYTKADLKAKKFVLLLREPVLRCAMVDDVQALVRCAYTLTVPLSHLGGTRSTNASCDCACGSSTTRATTSANSTTTAAATSTTSKPWWSTPKSTAPGS
jgi:hypothetical protein